MEKLILVFYVNVGNLSSSDVADVVEKIKKEISPKAEEFTYFIIPIHNEETRVECINPKLVSEEDFAHAKKFLQESEQKLTDLIIKLAEKTKEY